MAIGSRFYFIGVIAAVFFRTHLNQIIPVPIPTQLQPMAKQQEMIDLGIVFKAHTVVETIEAFLNARNQNAALQPHADPYSAAQARSANGT
jgi:hypothetical protein